MRAVIVTGAGRGFCAGQDLNDPDMSSPDGGAPDVGAVIERRYVPLALRIRSMPVPVIAAVNGVAAGAGANFALGCDMVIAARSAGFIQAFSKIGLIPDCGGTWLLPRLVGRARAIGLAMTGDKLSAEEAQRFGLIWQCVDDAALMDSAMALATQAGRDAEPGAGRDAPRARRRGDARLRRRAGAGSASAARAGPRARLWRRRGRLPAKARAGLHRPLNGEPMDSEHAADRLTPREDHSRYETDAPVLYAVADGIATLTLNRPQFGNAQNGQMTYALDAHLRQAVDDDAVRVIVLRGAGKHFNAGHDIGTPGQDLDKPFERVQLWWDHSNKPGAEAGYAREQEIYIGMCRRWHEIPKPTIAMVQGGCIAGGLMLAWVCDLIVAADDAFFQDPVVRMGVPGVEYFAHAQELNPRIAKEFLFLGERMSAERAYMMGMVNRVVPRERLEAETYAIAARIATQPRMGLALAKQVLNRVEDLQGLRASIDMAFGYHHFAHAHGQVVSGSAIGGQDVRSMAAANKSGSGEPR